MTIQHDVSVARSRHIALIALVLGITLVTGAVQGRLTQRWGPVPDMLLAVRHLEDIPKQLGDWQFLSDERIEESTVRMLSCVGYINRQYVNRKTGRTVWIAIILGSAGPVSVHTPEICYSSRAYEISESRKQVSLSDADGRTHSFWSLSFRSPNPSTDQLQVYYAWNGNGQWEASKSPRFEFAGRRSLFKLQIASLVPTATRSQAQDPCQEFLSALLRSGWIVGG